MSTTTTLTHHGPLNAQTRQHPSLAFIEKYSAQVDSGDLSDLSTTWYAPSAHFYNTDGVVYPSGPEIWTWMHGLFGQFERVRHDIKVVRVIAGQKTQLQGQEKSIGDLVLLDCDTTFCLREPLQGEGIVVPRMLAFLVGEAEEGAGTGGLWILEANTWWDSGVLGKEVGRRKDGLGKK